MGRARMAAFENCVSRNEPHFQVCICCIVTNGYDTCHNTPSVMMISEKNPQRQKACSCHQPTPRSPRREHQKAKSLTTLCLVGEICLEIGSLAGLSAAACAGRYPDSVSDGDRLGKHCACNLPADLFPQEQVSPLGIAFSAEERVQVQAPAGRWSVAAC